MALRYQRRTLFADGQHVKTYEGVDPLTGLPVLMYEFAGEPVAGLMALESENIPGVLDAATEGEQSQLVVSYPRGYAPLGQPLDVGLGTLLLDSSRALVDAARAGVIHGDLQAERFWAADNHVILEGFGAPWRLDGEASLANDVKDWAQAVLVLTNGAVSDGLAALLKQCQSSDIATRPSAADLFDELQQHRNAALKTKTLQDLQIDFAVETEPVASETPFNIGLEDAPSPNASVRAPSKSDRVVSAHAAAPSVVMGLPPDARSQSQKLSSTDFDLGLDEPEGKPEPDDQADFAKVLDDFDVPHTTASGSYASTKPLPNNDALLNRNTNQPAFVKNLPPGATFRAGEAGAAGSGQKVLLEDSFVEELETPSRSRRPLMIVLGAMIGALLIAGMVFVSQGFRTYTVPETAVNILVNVQIEPDNLPPIDLVVVSRPPQSRHQEGAVISQYPSGNYQLVLDKEGTWQFQGRFQDITSGVVTLTVPEQSGMVITMPELLKLEPPPEATDQP